MINTLSIDQEFIWQRKQKFGTIPMENTWHTKDIDDVLRVLNVTKSGLSEATVTERLNQYGHNELTEGKKVTPFEIFLNQFKNIFVVILIVATFVTFYIDFTSNEMPIDTLTIASIVVLNAVIGFFQEYRSEQALEAMKIIRRHQGITLEGTYTGKAFAAFLNDTARLDMRDKTILFWNTFNSRDLSAFTANVDYRDLPRPFHSYFTEDVQPLNSA